MNEYESLNKHWKGALLRREGLYSSLTSEWRKQRDKGAMSALSQMGTASSRPQGAGERSAAPGEQRLAEELEKAQHVQGNSPRF